MNLWPILVAGFFLELLELSWQAGSTLQEAFERMYRVYRRSVFLFLLGHTGYLYLLYISLAYDRLNWPMILALALKIADLFTKMGILDKIYVKKERDENLRQMLGVPVSAWMWFAAPLTYPWLLYLSFTME